MRTDSEVPIHYLRPNDKEWTPGDVLFFDTETDEEARDDGSYLLHPVLWVSLYRQRRTRTKTVREDRWFSGATAESLADMVDSVARTTRTLWVYAHNLAFDAAATGLPNRLTKLGWETTDFSVRGDSPWFRFRCGDRRVVLVDSWSWLPTALEKVGAAVGLDKAPLPEVRAADEATEARCRQDVSILAAAVCGLMDWWDRRRLGRWTLTGAGCGWNAYRHIPSRQRVLIDPDPEARGFERQALYGGRREAFHVGSPDGASFTDWDLINAYPTAAVHFPLPIGRGKRLASIPFDHPALRSDGADVIAWATVVTEEPAAPCRAAGAVFYPVGRFRSVLCGPELRDLVKRGLVESIGPGYVYKTGWALEPWARWVLQVVRGELPDTPEVARIAAKHWSRVVIGKWSARTHRMERWGPQGHPGWHVETAKDPNHRGPAAVVDFGGWRHLVIGDQETDNGFPAITAFVESYVRLALSRGLAAYRGGRVLSCDTDGFLASSDLFAPQAAGRARIDGRAARSSRVAREALAALSESVRPFTVAAKSTWSAVSILGPQHVTRDRERSYSGIRRDAVEVAPGVFEAHTWPKLTWQMERGRPDGYVRPLQRSRVVGPYAHRWVLVDGSTVAPRAELGEDGGNSLAPWPAGLEAMLSPWQHPALHRLRPDV